MFCAECGKEVPDGIRFCPYCGETIVTLSEEDKKEHIESVSEEKEIVVKEGDTDTTSIQPTLLYGKYTESDKKSIRTAVLMMVIGLIGAVLCFGIVLYKNPNGNASIALRKLIGMEQKIGVAKNSKGIEDQLKNLVKKYTTSLYFGDVEGLESVATPIIEQEKLYCQCHGEFYKDYENGLFRYTNGVNEGDYIIYFSCDLVGKKQGVTYPMNAIVYAETDKDGYIFINEIYSYCNAVFQVATEDWEDTKYNALIKYSESNEIADLMSEIQDAQEAVLEDAEVSDWIEAGNQRFQEMLHELNK